MFYDNLKKTCEEKGTTVSAVLKYLNISTGNGSAWKKGVMPASDIVLKLANHLDVTADYLLDDTNDENISIKVKKNTSFSTFHTLKALPQRWVSLGRGSAISDEQTYRIAQYVNCNIRYLWDASNIEFSPCVTREIDNSTELLGCIFIIMDACADSDDYRVFQLQLSRIVVYWLDKKGFTADKLREFKKLEQHKLNYILTGKENLDPTLNYGFNFSDLAALHDFTGLSFHYMFTGSEQSEEERLRAKVAELEKEIAELKEKNSPSGNHMEKKILDGKNTPLSECVSADDLAW